MNRSELEVLATTELVRMEAQAKKEIIEAKEIEQAEAEVDEAIARRWNLLDRAPTHQKAEATEPSPSLTFEPTESSYRADVSQQPVAWYLLRKRALK